MAPMANYAYLNDISKISLHQDMLVPQHEDEKNQYAQQPGQSVWADKQAGRTVLVLENFSAKVRTFNSM